MKRMYDRFIEYWKAKDEERLPDYVYDETEKLVYWFIALVIGIMCIPVGVVIVATVPIWSIPYLVWKNKKLKKEEGK